MIGWFRRRFAESLRARRFESKARGIGTAVYERRYADADDLARDLVDLEPENPVARAYLGWTRLLLDDHPGARACLGVYVRNAGRSAFRARTQSDYALPVAGFLVRAYYHLGRLGKSRLWMRRVVALTPKNQDTPEDLYYRGLLARAGEAEHRHSPCGTPQRGDRRAGLDEAIGWILRADVADPDFLHKRIDALRERIEGLLEERRGREGEGAG